MDPDTIANAIWGQESGRGANTRTSVTGAVGNMQIEPSTFAQYARPGESINNPADNIAVGHRIVNDLYQKAGGDPARVAVGYFSGPGNISPAGAALPYLHNYHDPNGKYTADYANDVLKRLDSDQPLGTTLTSVPLPPVRPADVVAATPVAPGPTLGQNIQKGDVGAALAQLTAPKTDPKTGAQQPGTSALNEIAGAFKPQQQQQSQMHPSAPMLPQDPTAAVAPAAQQLLSQTFANASKPLAWSIKPFGSDAGPQGTTLTSVGPQYV